MDAELDPENLLGSLKSTDALYYKAKFKDEAKFGILWKAAKKVPDFSSFSIQRCATEYKILRAEIKDLEYTKRDFKSATGFYGPMNAPIYRDTIKDPRLIVNTDALVANFENKICTLAQKMAEMTLFLKKSQAVPSSQYSNIDRT